MNESNLTDEELREQLHRAEHGYKSYRAIYERLFAELVRRGLDDYSMLERYPIHTRSSLWN